MWLADACHSDQSQDGLKDMGLGVGDENERKKETPQGFSEEGGEGEDPSH